LIPIPLSLLTGSTNLIAVEVHQDLTNRFDNFDLYFDLEFATYEYNPGAVLQIHTDGSDAIVQWPDYLPDWRLEQSPDLTNSVTNTPTLENMLSTVQLPLQSQMFFRLRQLASP
jgi:hypothetical protein